MKELLLCNAQNHRGEECAFEHTKGGLGRVCERKNPPPREKARQPVFPLHTSCPGGNRTRESGGLTVEPSVLWHQRVSKCDDQIPPTEQKEKFASHRPMQKSPALLRTASLSGQSRISKHLQKSFHKEEAGIRVNKMPSSEEVIRPQRESEMSKNFLFYFFLY